MSEVTVFLRQDPNRASKKEQKRPLSIITENDSDEPEAINYTKHQDGTDCHGKENTTCCQNNPDPNKTCQDGEIICKVAEIARITRNPSSASDYKTILSSKHHVSSFSSSKLIKFPSIKLPSETRTCAMENISGHVTLVVDSNDSKCPDEIFWKQQTTNNKSSSSVNEDTKSADLQQCNQTAVPTDNSVPVFSIDTQINSANIPKPVDVNDLAKIRETSDRLHIALPLSTSPSTPSPTRSSTFCYRKWQQTSAPKNFQELKSPTSANTHQLLLNTNGGPPVFASLASSSDSEDLTDKSSSENISPSNSNLGSMFSKFSSSKLSGYFSRRMSNESTGSISESDLSDGDIGTEDSPSAYLSYFRRLKETTDKLHLSTRRPSIMLWRQQYLESQTFSRVKSNLNSDISDDSLTFDRKHRIDKALEWLRNQLQDMRSQDQHLARQLLSIRQDIHKLKLQRSTEEHQELIDDFHFELQELQEFSDILDLPMPEYSSNPLKHLGITRMNISARRFSAC